MTTAKTTTTTTRRNEMTTRKYSDVVYVLRVVKAFGEENWHGPMTYGKARADGHLSTSGGTVRVTTYTEDEKATGDELMAYCKACAEEIAGQQ